MALQRDAGTLVSRPRICIDDPRTHPVVGGGLHRAGVPGGRGVAGAVVPARARCAAADQPAGGAQPGAVGRSRDRCHDSGAAGAGHLGQHRRTRLPALPCTGASGPAVRGRRQHRAVRPRAQRSGQCGARMGHAAAEGAARPFSPGVVQRPAGGVGRLRRPDVQAAADRGGGAGDARRPGDCPPRDGVQPAALCRPAGPAELRAAVDGRGARQPRGLRGAHARAAALSGRECRPAISVGGAPGARGQLRGQHRRWRARGGDVQPRRQARLDRGHRCAGERTQCPTAALVVAVRRQRGVAAGSRPVAGARDRPRHCRAYPGAGATRAGDRARRDGGGGAVVAARGERTRSRAATGAGAAAAARRSPPERRSVGARQPVAAADGARRRSDRRLGYRHEHGRDPPLAAARPLLRLHRRDRLEPRSVLRMHPSRRSRARSPSHQADNAASGAHGWTSFASSGPMAACIG